MARLHAISFVIRVVAGYCYTYFLAYFYVSSYDQVRKTFNSHLHWSRGEMKNYFSSKHVKVTYTGVCSEKRRSLSNMLKMLLLRSASSYRVWKKRGPKKKRTTKKTWNINTKFVFSSIRLDYVNYISNYWKSALDDESRRKTSSILQCIAFREIVHMSLGVFSQTKIIHMRKKDLYKSQIDIEQRFRLAF